MPKHTDRLVPVSPAAALPPLLERRVRTKAERLRRSMV